MTVGIRVLPRTPGPAPPSPVVQRARREAELVQLRQLAAQIERSGPQALAASPASVAGFLGRVIHLIHLVEEELDASIPPPPPPPTGAAAARQYARPHLEPASRCA